MNISGNTPRVAEYPRPNHFILHVSDTHLIPDGNLLYESVDAETHLRRLFQGFEATGAKPEAIVFTGDLADRGDPAAYAALRGIVEPVAARMGAQVIWVMGNHDVRPAFRAELLGQQASTRPVDRVHDVNGLRVIALDSSVPGAHHGEIAGDQLDWLAEELASPAPHGTILAIHHPPVPSMLDLAVLVELRDQASLAEVLEGSDVRGIIAGHLHYSTTATFAGIPVSVASSACYTQDLNVQVGGTHARDGAQAFNLVHVYENTVLHSVVPVGDYPTVSHVGADDSAAELAKAGVTVDAAADLPAADAEEPLTAPVEPPTAPIGVLASV